MLPTTDGHTAERAKTAGRHIEKTEHAAANDGGRVNLHQGLGDAAERKLEEPGEKKECDRKRIGPRQCERRQGTGPQRGELQG
jgi:hypothetical protein